MTRRDALHYGVIVGIYLAVCILAGEMTTLQPRILLADKPRVVAASVGKTLTAAEPELVSMGTFTAFAYCSCPQCCGRWSGGPTASGTMPEAGRTAAADWAVLPAGTEIYIDGLGWRTVEDTGSGITGGKLDIYMESHQAALEWGVRKLEVWIKNEHDL